MLTIQITKKNLIIFLVCLFILFAIPAIAQYCVQNKDDGGLVQGGGIIRIYNPGGAWALGLDSTLMNTTDPEPIIRQYINYGYTVTNCMAWGKAVCTNGISCPAGTTMKTVYAASDSYTLRASLICVKN